MQNNMSEMVRYFIKTDRLHHKVVDRRISELGLHRSQHFLLMLLSHKTNPMTQREIADELNTSPAAVTVKLRKLESDGLITRKTADGRTNAVEISKKGAEIVNRAHRIFESVDRAMVEGVTEEMYNSFISTLDIMNENLNKLLLEEEYEVE